MAEIQHLAGSGEEQNGHENGSPGAVGNDPIHAGEQFGENGKDRGQDEPAQMVNLTSERDLDKGERRGEDRDERATQGDRKPSISNVAPKGLF